VILFFIYVIQGVVVYINEMQRTGIQYNNHEWIDLFSAYSFAVLSSVIFVLFISIGMKGWIDGSILDSHRKNYKSGFFFITLVIAFFAIWSLIMFKYKIGITIFKPESAPLPFKLGGLLYYGRYFIQPLILSYLMITFSHAKSGLKLAVSLMLILLSVWVSLTSGSRLMAVLFSFPIYFLFKGRLKYVVLIISVINIFVASASRYFFLPSYLGLYYEKRYANIEIQTSFINGINTYIMDYIVLRLMGINELIATLNYGAITESFSDALSKFISYFIPFYNLDYESVTIGQIYGMGIDRKGVALDVFGNYWHHFGGSMLLYVVGISIIGWMFGRILRIFNSILIRRQLQEILLLIFLTLFIVFIQGRAHFFIFILLSLSLYVWIDRTKFVWHKSYRTYKKHN